VHTIREVNAARLGSARLGSRACDGLLPATNLEVELGDALEALLQVRLDTQRILRLGEDLEQIVGREEEEAREVEHLRLEVVVEPLLHLLHTAH
jgi:hypothetical protein